MSDIQHPPWVGAKYHEGHPRLLILGESHHCDDPEAVGLTIPVVEEWLPSFAKKQSNWAKLLK